jgi:hypothetical protein
MNAKNAKNAKDFGQPARLAQTVYLSRRNRARGREPHPQPLSREERGSQSQSDRYGHPALWSPWPSPRRGGWPTGQVGSLARY